jgi:hypothetical protein
VANNTLREWPELFDIPTPIQIDILEQYLSSHPNQPLVQSVIAGFREGFWPWAAETPSFPGDHLDYNQPRDLSEEELNFLKTTCANEEQAGRFSAPFGPDLLPGMISEPVFAVPKPRSTKLRLVTHHSAGTFSLNSLIPREDRAVRFDNLNDFGKMLRAFHAKHGRGPRWLFKSDVANAFRLLPMHPLWQLRQIISVWENGKFTRWVDRCCCFGCGGSPHLFCVVMGLVLWIAIRVKSIDGILHYMDDNFGYDDDPDLAFYDKYAEYFPKKQVQLLQLWDELGIPHERRKQEYGPSLEIIGLYVDPQEMTITMSADRRSDLISAIDNFINCKVRRQRLLDWQRLAGWIHWSLNAYPLLRPAVNPVHAKIADKTHRFAGIPINREVKSALGWLRDRLASSNGVSILEAELWGQNDANLIIYCDACTGDTSGRKAGLGFWVPSQGLGFFADGPEPSAYPPNLRHPGSIFYLEALCILAAILWSASLNPPPKRLLIYTDSINSADMFNTMRANPGYNDILMTAVEALIDNAISLRVYHIAGEENTIADALSRSYFDLIQQQQPNLILHHFQSPRLDAGGIAK